MNISLIYDQQIRHANCLIILKKMKPGADLNKLYEDYVTQIYELVRKPLERMDLSNGFNDSTDKMLSVVEMSKSDYEKIKDLDFEDVHEIRQRQQYSVIECYLNFMDILESDDEFLDVRITKDED